MRPHKWEVGCTAVASEHPGKTGEMWPSQKTGRSQATNQKDLICRNSRAKVYLVDFSRVCKIYIGMCVCHLSALENPWFWKSRPERVTISKKSVKTLVKTRSSYQNRRRTPWLQNEDRSIPTGPLLEGTASIYQLFWCKQVLDPHISKPFRRQNLRWEGSNLRFASSSSWRVERRSWNNWRLTSWVSCNMSQHVATILDDQKFTHTHMCI